MGRVLAVAINMRSSAESCNRYMLAAELCKSATSAQSAADWDLNAAARRAVVRQCCASSVTFFGPTLNTAINANINGKPPL
eukprot:6197135-Pleurochrysis_carterae.AAC.3